LSIDWSKRRPEKEFAGKGFSIPARFYPGGNSIFLGTGRPVEAAAEKRPIPFQSWPEKPWA
jgi:hypothetical protein